MREQLLSQFLKVNGTFINLLHVAFVDFRADGSAVIHIGPNSIAATGEEATALLAIFEPEETKSAEYVVAPVTW